MVSIGHQLQDTDWMEVFFEQQKIQVFPSVSVLNIDPRFIPQIPLKMAGKLPEAVIGEIFGHNRLRS